MEGSVRNLKVGGPSEATLGESGTPGLQLKVTEDRMVRENVRKFVVVYCGRSSPPQP